MPPRSVAGSRTFRLLLGAALIAATGVIAGQDPANQAGQSGNSEGVVYRGELQPVRFDISPPLTEIPEVPASPRAAREERDVPYPIGVQDLDTAVQHLAHPGELPGEIPSPIGNFTAFSGTARPPDPVGDVGPNHYVAMANVSFAVYNKTGGLVYGPVSNNTLWSGFGGACQTQNAGDPVVIYDQLADRWLLMQFTATGTSEFLCVALSTTGNPAGSYYRWAIPTGTNFPDYPKVAMWPSPSAYIFTTREFSNSTGAFVGVGVYAMNRAQAIAGNASPQIPSWLLPPGGTPYRVGDGLLPADFDGTRLPPSGSPAFLLGSQDNGAGAPSDALNLYRVSINFGGVSVITGPTVLATAAFDSFFPCSPGSRDCIPQPGTTQKLDHQGYRQRVIHRLAYRNHGTHQSLVTNQSVEAATNMSGVRWYEVRDPGGTPAIYQQGTYAPGTTDGIHRWMGSIAQDQNGNMGLGYSVSSGSVAPGIRYTGRLATDALGSMPQGEATIVNGVGSQTNSARWGDYTSMNVDPVDDCTLWYVNEFFAAVGSASWNLRVGSFKFPSCSPSATVTSLWPIGTVAVGGTARMWAQVRNDGTTAMPAGSRVWFLSNATPSGANSWVGYRDITGLAAGATAWYYIDYVIPAGTSNGTKNYYAQVWFGSYAKSALRGPQTFTVGVVNTAVVDQLWSVPGAYPGASVRFWALVRNTGSAALGGDSRVVFWSSITNGDVGSASIVGLAAGASRWYSFQYSIPTNASPDGIRNYWAQTRLTGATSSSWRGPQDFRFGFNDPFTSSIAAWPIVAGSWSHSSGTYLYTAGSASSTASVRHAEGTKYLDYEVRAWRYGCDACANRIMLRGTPTPLGSGNAWNSNYMFQYTRGGQFSVFKTVSGVTTALQGWATTPAINQGNAWNNLRVVSYGSFFQFFINGVLVWQGYDASLPTAGQVGIGAYNDTSAGNSFWVDYARGIPQGTGTDAAETAELPKDTISDMQLQLNAAANALPVGDVNRSRIQ